MHRKKALSYIEDIFTDESGALLFYIGRYLASESSRSSVVKLLSHMDYFSILFGMSMSIDKKIIIVCEDVYLLGHVNSLIQVAVGRPKNLIILCLVTNTYTVDCSQPTLFSSINSVKGVLFNSGFLVHDYTQYFKNKVELKNLCNRLLTINGPLISTISIEDNRMFNIGEVEDNFKKFVDGLA